MTGADLLSEAVAELYAADPDSFTERRGALAAQARAAGDAPAAKIIAKLRRPTRSAWIVNQLVRSDPGVPARLTALGDQLRAAESALDGARIRELSAERRQLIDALARAALATLGVRPAPAALREEVAATFSAALADPQLAGRLAAGTLLRAERRAGFGPAAPLALLPPPPAGRRPGAKEARPVNEAAPARPKAEPSAQEAPAAAARPAPGKRAPPARPAAKAAPAPTAKAAATAEAKAAARAEADAKARTKAKAEARAKAESEARTRAEATARTRAEAAERQRREAVATAQRAAAEADRATASAADAEQQQEAAVRQIERQLTAAREHLADLRAAARRAKNAQRKAHQDADRLR